MAAGGSLRSFLSGSTPAFHSQGHNFHSHTSARFIPYLRKYIAANNGIKTKSGLMYVFSSANDDVSIKIYMAVVATYVTRNATNIFPEPTSSSIGNTFAQNT